MSRAGSEHGAIRAPRVGRRPGNQDTRGAILTAAREAFAARGFSGASLRSIAAAAEVDAALIHHYFDTKQELFLAVVKLPIDLPRLVQGLAAGDRTTLGTRLIATATEVWEGPARPGLVAAVRATIADEELSRPFTEFLSFEVLGRALHQAGLDPAEARRRGALVASQMIGLIVGRYVVELPALTELSRAEVIAAIGPTVQRYLDGDLGPDPEGSR